MRLFIRKSMEIPLLLAYDMNMFLLSLHNFPDYHLSIRAIMLQDTKRFLVEQINQDGQEATSPCASVYSTSSTTRSLTPSFTTTQDPA